MLRFETFNSKLYLLYKIPEINHTNYLNYIGIYKMIYYTLEVFRSKIGF